MNNDLSVANHPTLIGYSLVEQLDYVDFYESSDKEIIVAAFKESTVINEEMAKESLDLILNYKHGRPTFGITDASARFLDFEPKARNYFRKHMRPEDTPLHAILVADTATRVLANLFARFERPKIPSRVFNNIKEAVEWIEEAK